MATPEQRGSAILDALLNTTATVAQRQRVVAAFGSAGNYLREVAELTKNRVKRHENTAAREATESAVDSDFAETP